MLNIEVKRQDITNITLLSIEEAQKLPIEVRKYSVWWWLRSPGDNPYIAATASHFGYVVPNGDYVDYDLEGVRPVLTIKNLDSQNLTLYSNILINEKKFIVIGQDAVLYDDRPIRHYFNRRLAQGNDYETSGIKKFVENDFLEIIRKA